MILFQSVTKKYHHKTVLSELNFTVRGQEFVSITGPSGAGKSTIINLLIGVEKPTHGLISVDGYEISKMPPSLLQYYRRRIGIVFQDYKLLPKKTVAENIAFAMEVCGHSADKIQKRVPRLLEVVGLQDHANHFPNQLSGGESQRVALARALIHNPRLIIADEPTGNLDPENGREIIELLLKLHHLGVTVILATHDRDMVDLINRRVIHLHKGEIVSDIERAGYASEPSVPKRDNTIYIQEHFITHLDID